MWIEMFGFKLCKIYYEMYYIEIFKNKSIGVFNKWVKWYYKYVELNGFYFENSDRFWLRCLMLYDVVEILNYCVIF